MAGGNVQPGTSAPEQRPTTYGQQTQPTYQQPYGQQSSLMDIAALLRKTFLIIIVAIGALFLFIGRLFGVFFVDTNGQNAGHAMSIFGGFMIAVPAVIWALGSKRTTDMQNLGLLIIAALMFVAMVY